MDDHLYLGWQFASPTASAEVFSYEANARAAVRYVAERYGPLPLPSPPWWARAVAWTLVVYCAVKR